MAAQQAQQNRQLADQRKRKVELNDLGSKDDYNAWKFQLDGILDTDETLNLVNNFLAAVAVNPTNLEIVMLRVVRDQILGSLEGEFKTYVTSCGSHDCLEIIRFLENEYGVVTEVEEYTAYTDFMNTIKMRSGKRQYSFALNLSETQFGQKTSELDPCRRC